MHKGNDTGKSFASEKWLDLLIIAVILIFALTICMYGLMDVGLKYDEPVTVASGIYYIHNLEVLNFGPDVWAQNMEHPPVAKYIYGVANLIFNGDGFSYNTYVAAKAASALMGALTCVLTFLIGRELYDRRVGLLAAFILALTPVFLAHTQIAAIDAPIAFFFTLTMFLFIIAMRRNSLPYYGASAISLALLVSTKFNGILILPVMAILYLLYRREHPLSVKKVKMKGSARSGGDRSLMDAIKPYVSPISLIGYCLVVVLIFFMLWPWLWSDTISHIGMTLNHWETTPEDFFLGTVQAAPLYYYPVYFLVTTPVLLLIPLIIGIIAAARSKDVFKYGILLWLVIPFAYGFTSFIQNGMRYLIMIYPAVALLCADGLWQVSGLGDKIHVPRKAMFAALGILAALYLAASVALVHPYYLDYYNELSGGQKNIQDNRLFDVAWWNEGTSACVGYVETHASNATVSMVVLPQDASNIRFFMKNDTYDFKAVPINGRFVPLNVSTDEDYAIVSGKVMEYYDVTIDPKFKPVHVEQVGGATLCTVYRNTEHTNLTT
jgi:4-amino-4-deoxy-L-arabinose transferase-like glycosyltransferase